MDLNLHCVKAVWNGTIFCATFYSATRCEFFEPKSKTQNLRWQIFRKLARVTGSPSIFCATPSQNSVQHGHTCSVDAHCSDSRNVVSRRCTEIISCNMHVVKYILHDVGRKIDSLNIQRKVDAVIREMLWVDVVLKSSRVTCMLSSTSCTMLVEKLTRWTYNEKLTRCCANYRCCKLSRVTQPLNPNPTANCSSFPKTQFAWDKWRSFMHRQLQ